MATRFHFLSSGSGTPNISPTFNAGWEQTGEAVRRILVRNTIGGVVRATFTTILTVPITTTQDILGLQEISEPLRAQTIAGTFSLVIRCVENATTNNVTLAVVVYVVSQDGGTVRGTLFSNFDQDTEFGTTAATRIVNAQSVSSTPIINGDRIVVEVGGHAAGPTAAGSYTFSGTGENGTDWALTSGLTTSLTAWCEFSQDLFFLMPNNYQSANNSIGGSLSVSEKIR